MKYDFENLQVYQEGMDLVEKVYWATKNFPSEEQFGIISQMRRAAVSVPLNIAEGKGRQGVSLRSDSVDPAFCAIGLFKRERIGRVNRMLPKHLWEDQQIDQRNETLAPSQVSFPYTPATSVSLSPSQDVAVSFVDEPVDSV